MRLARIRPIDEAVAKANVSLQTHEGYTFEKLVRQITEECSRKGVGDFPLTELVAGYWNKADGSDIEIDMIALDEANRRIRFGSCKRSASAHDSQALASLEEHEAESGALFTNLAATLARVAAAFLLAMPSR